MLADLIKSHWQTRLLVVILRLIECAVVGFHPRELEIHSLRSSITCLIEITLIHDRVYPAFIGLSTFFAF